MKLRHSTDLHFGMYTVECLFMNLAEEEANRDMAKSVMDEVLSDGRLVRQIMERQLLPDLCSMLRRALGLTKAEQTKGKETNALLCAKMKGAFEQADEIVKHPNLYSLYGLRDNSGRVRDFTVKVAKRYEKLRELKAKAAEKTSVEAP